MCMYSGSFNLIKKFWAVVHKWMRDKEEQEEDYESI